MWIKDCKDMTKIRNYNLKQKESNSFLKKLTYSHSKHTPGRDFW